LGSNYILQMENGQFQKFQWLALQEREKFIPDLRIWGAQHTLHYVKFLYLSRNLNQNMLKIRFFFVFKIAENYKTNNGTHVFLLLTYLLFYAVVSLHNSAVFMLVRAQ